MKKKKNLYRILESVSIALVSLTSVNVGDEGRLLYYLILSSIGLSIAFILAITQGLLKEYSKSLILVSCLYAFLILLMIIDRKIDLSFIIINIAATISTLTYYNMSRKAKEEKVLKAEEDDRPFIISKPSDFAIKESDFEVEELEIEK